ncbi:MAG: AAA family ATPase [Patescibacteria group bacterium]
MKNKKIIAVLGLPGSGKSEVINYLIKKLNCLKVYFGDVTFDEMKIRGLKINEKNEKITREGLRKKFGQNYYAEQMIKKINNINEPVILVESLYSWNEYLLFKETYQGNFSTIAVYSSPKTRYSRLSKRKVRPLTPEEAQGRDYAQIINLTQANPIAMANYTVINEDTLETLYKQVDDLVDKI